MASRINPWWAANYRLILVLILLVAAVLRLYGLDNVSPPGLEHDEVAHWLINRDILAGNHALYFTDAYGHEAGFHYIQTPFMLFLGDNAFALRLPSAFAGLLLVAVSFTLARRLFGLRVALMSAALLAVLFWPVFYSRLALRAISLPLLSGLSAYFWWKGWAVGRKAFTAESPVGRQRNGNAESFHSSSGPITSSPLLWFAIAGLFAGLSLYTYMASRVVPIFYLLFTTYLLLFHRHALQERWRGVLLFFLTFGVIAAPLTIYLLGHPGTEARIDEVNAPLLALATGNLRPVATNTTKFLAMFGFSGDPLWRQNVASLPVFDPLLALFFYIGVLISLWRWREPRHLFIILWLFTAAIPSILTIDAPSSIRIINALPILTLFPIIGLEVIHFFRSLSTVSTRLSPKNRVFAALIALIVLFTIL
jgi:4-amino-4-deoxy-L-arabinose transferase-like glycosyltransferase